MVECGVGKTQHLRIENLKEVSCEFQITPQFTLSARKREAKGIKYNPFQISKKTGTIHKSEKMILQVCFEPREERKFEQVFIISLRESCKKIELRCVGLGYMPPLDFIPKEIIFYSSLPCRENFKKLEIRNFGIFDSKLVLLDSDEQIYAEYERVCALERPEENDFRNQNFLRFGIDGKMFEGRREDIDMNELMEDNEFHLPREVDRKEESLALHEQKMQDFDAMVEENDVKKIKEFILGEIEEMAQAINLEQEKLWRIQKKSDSLDSKREEEPKAYSWGNTDDVKVTPHPLVVLLVGDRKDQVSQIASFLGKVQSREILNFEKIIEWNTNEDFEVGIRIEEEIEQFEGKFGDISIYRGCSKDVFMKHFY